MKVEGFEGRELRLLPEVLRPVQRFLHCIEAIRREPTAPREAKLEGAPGNAKWEPETRSIVLYDKGVYHGDRIDPVQFRRSVYHELAHALLHATPSLIARWAQSTSGDGYVDEYAKTGPEEDFADSFSEAILFPREVQRIAPRKYAFMKQLFETSTEKTAMSHMLNAFAGELVKIAYPPTSSAGLPPTHDHVARAERNEKIRGLKSQGKRVAAIAAVPAAILLGRHLLKKHHEKRAFHIPGGLLKALPKVGLGLAGAGAVGLGAERIGEHRGERHGVEESMGQIEGVAREAYTTGVQRGALAMRNAILSQMKSPGSKEA